ncbi:MAG TPA: DUF3142 domain-containing protein [Candidatus Angelobacter sp.]|nr:DUF3142 domain-containing protein [Candidatus Angelobacter sp.]
MAALLVFAASGGKAPSGAVPHALQSFPRVMLWAWEAREDLRYAPPDQYGVAYLAKTIFIGERVSVAPREEPLLIAPGARTMAVVRIEAPRNRARLDIPRLAETVARLIIPEAQRQQVFALQIDFDAAQSQRSFYRNLIEEVRIQMPAGMPLSIAALASWCKEESWLQGLPVNEAVPMLFRMEEGPKRKNRPGWSYRAEQELCQPSVGVSTDEPWPAISQKQRIYVFHPRAWNPVALKNVERLVTP